VLSDAQGAAAASVLELPDALGVPLAEIATELGNPAEEWSTGARRPAPQLRTARPTVDRRGEGEGAGAAAAATCFGGEGTGLGVGGVVGDLLLQLARMATGQLSQFDQEAGS